ncbi:MAG TPA: S41 family peptidase [Byssovorax sp.]|jgi:carboxyl-terminal processing protease
MLPASNRGAGECLGFPDICLTPAAPAPIPTPYPNIGMNAMAAPFSPTVMLSMVPALNQGSMIPMTMGDEAGSASPIKGPARYTMGNPIVKVNALPAINLTCPTTGNNMNDELGAVLVPSVTNVFFTSIVAGAPTRGPLGRDAVLALAAAIEGARAEVDASDDDVAIVRPGVFGFATSTEIANAIAGARAVVIDLRGHPGGDLDSAAAFAADFLDEDAIVARRVDSDGDEELLRALGPPLHGAPVVVLVDRDTASAAEVVAAALADHGRALLVGERTRGKGTAERIVARFDAPGAAYATVARVRSPSGAEIDGAGVAPHVEIDPGRPIDDAATQTITRATSPSIALAVACAWDRRSPER